MERVKSKSETKKGKLMENYIWKKGRPPVKCSDLMEWSKKSNNTGRQVGYSVVQDVVVSTVFLCLDHSWKEEDGPILFETMVFGGDEDQMQVRYRTENEARNGHWDIFLKIRDKIRERKANGNKKKESE